MSKFPHQQLYLCNDCSKPVMAVPEQEGDDELSCPACQCMNVCCCPDCTAQAEFYVRQGIEPLSISQPIRKSK